MAEKGLQPRRTVSKFVARIEKRIDALTLEVDANQARTAVALGKIEELKSVLADFAKEGNGNSDG